jgi:hypothetical protein
MKNNYEYIVKKITKARVKDEKGTKNTETLMLAGDGVLRASITAENGAFDGIEIGSKVSMNITTPQITLRDM